MPAQPQSSPRPAAVINVARRTRNMGTTLVLEGPMGDPRGNTGFNRVIDTEEGRRPITAQIIPHERLAGNCRARAKNSRRSGFVGVTNLCGLQRFDRRAHGPAKPAFPGLVGRQGGTTRPAPPILFLEAAPCPDAPGPGAGPRDDSRTPTRR